MCCDWGWDPQQLLLDNVILRRVSNEEVYIGISLGFSNNTTLGTVRCLYDFLEKV